MTAPSELAPTRAGPLEQVSFHPLTLRFDDPDVEQTFLRTYATKSARQIRWVFGLTAIVLVLIAAFGTWLFGQVPTLVSMLRVGVLLVAVSALVGIFLSKVCVTRPAAFDRRRCVTDVAGGAVGGGAEAGRGRPASVRRAAPRWSGA